LGTEQFAIHVQDEGLAFVTEREASNADDQTIGWYHAHERTWVETPEHQPFGAAPVDVPGTLCVEHQATLSLGLIEDVWRKHTFESRLCIGERAHSSVWQELYECRLLDCEPQFARVLAA
jgi:hypothetical protein